MDFRKIEFGLADAENERVDAPHLLLDAYLDADGQIEAILGPSRYLIVGGKGSGKSAIISRIALQAAAKGYEARIDVLRKFPYSAFPNVLPGSEEAPETRLPDHWEFVLLLRLFEMVHAGRDNRSLSTVDGSELWNVLGHLG